MTVFDLENFDSEFVLTFLHHDMGALMDDIVNRRKEIEAQTNFILDILEEVKPKNILEIGTHTANFCYLIGLWDKKIHVDTFDIDKKYKIFADMAREKCEMDLSFYCQNSVTGLSQFNPKYQIDLAWVDGNHDYIYVLNDLFNCAKLNIPHILCDDARHLITVSKAIEDFLYWGLYSKISESPKEDDRGIVYLKKNV